MSDIWNEIDKICMPAVFAFIIFNPIYRCFGILILEPWRKMQIKCIYILVCMSKFRLRIPGHVNSFCRKYLQCFFFLFAPRILLVHGKLLFLKIIAGPELVPWMSNLAVFEWTLPPSNKQINIANAVKKFRAN